MTQQQEPLSSLVIKARRNWIFSRKQTRCGHFQKGQTGDSARKDKRSQQQHIYIYTSWPAHDNIKVAFSNRTPVLHLLSKGSAGCARLIGNSDQAPALNGQECDSGYMHVVYFGMDAAAAPLGRGLSRARLFCPAFHSPRTPFLRSAVKANKLARFHKVLRTPIRHVYYSAAQTMAQFGQLKGVFLY
jgi:hypothetical protein